MSWDADIDEIKRRRELAKQQGGKEAVAPSPRKGPSDHPRADRHTA